MTLTLEQLLLLARMENPNTIAQKNNVFLPTLIDDILTKYKREITNKELKVNVELDDAEESTVHRYYANLILDNIIENAIKYSKDLGTIHISLKRKENHAICIIEDDGIGIRKEELDKLYNNFYRSDALEHKHILGNGLGLSIVKKSAEAIGAQIKIESELKKGTSCTIVF